jgi:hypothetical protein
MNSVRPHRQVPLTLTGWIVVLSAPALLACLAGLFLR